MKWDVWQIPTAYWQKLNISLHVTASEEPDLIRWHTEKCGFGHCGWLLGAQLISTANLPGGPWKGKNNSWRTLATQRNSGFWAFRAVTEYMQSKCLNQKKCIGPTSCSDITNVKHDWRMGKISQAAFLESFTKQFLFNAIFALYLSNSLTKTVQFLSLDIIHTMLIATSIINYL